MTDAAASAGQTLDHPSSRAESDVQILPAAVTDAAEILTLQKLAYLSEAALYDDHTIPPLHQTLPEMERDLGAHLYLKAVVDGRLVGSVRGKLEGTTCYVGRLIVHPDLQNQGIGTRLMRAIEVQFPGAQRYELFTGDRSEKNLHLYHKLGYRVIRSQPLTPRVTLAYLEKRP